MGSYRRVIERKATPQDRQELAQALIKQSSYRVRVNYEGDDWTEVEFPDLPDDRVEEAAELVCRMLDAIGWKS